MSSLPSLGQVDGEDVVYPDLRAILLMIEEVDQEIREELISKGMGNLDSLDIARQHAVDETTKHILIKIIREYGWPTREMVGLKGVDAAFLIVQHADHAFQKEMLPNIRSSYERGDLLSDRYALFLDRILVKDGLPQRYGTQASLKNGGLVIDPVEDKERLDERRAELGLEPMKDYIRRLEELYGVPVKR